MSKKRSPMTDEEAAEKMRACDSGDNEAAHSAADDLLCELLKQLGYSKTVEAFQKIEKWYA